MLHDITVLDASQSDAVTWLSGATTLGEVDIHSVKDMVNKLLARVKGQDRLRTLTIVGHGGRWGMYVGKDGLSLDTLRSHDRELRRLNSLFAPSATVELGGCFVGRDPEFVRRLSAIWYGVTVKAYSAGQRPLIPGNEGGERSCVRMRCAYSGRTFVDKMDEFLNLVQ